MRTTVLLACLGIACAAGCGPGAPEPAPRPTTTEPEVPPTPPPTEALPEPDDEAAAAPVEPPTAGVVGLTRRDVDAALADTAALDAYLVDGDSDPGHGRRLLHVVDVPRGSLLERLGLRSGDVILRVNRRWVQRDRANPLWEALRGRRPVTVIVLRDGTPRTYQYVVD